MADSSKSKSGGGCLGKFLFLVVLLSAGMLGCALFFITRPQDLTDIGGYGPQGKAAPVRDLKTVLKNSVTRGYPVTLTEAEINQWLGRTLTTKQGGLLAANVTLDRVWIRLEDGHAEVVMERRIMNHPFTVSMFLQVAQTESVKGLHTEIQLHGGPYHESLPKPPRGGRFGRLVVPQGFLLLVMPAYRNLAALFQEEIHLGFEEMARIKIEKNRLVLDPRIPGADASGLPQTF